MRFENKAVLFSPKRSDYFQKRTLFFGRQVARFSQTSCAYKFLYQKPNLRLEPQSRKTICLLIAIKISLNIQIDLFVYLFVFKITNMASFPSKTLNYTVLKKSLQKLFTLTVAKITTSTGIDIAFPTIAEKNESKYVVSHVQAWLSS